MGLVVAALFATGLIALAARDRVDPTLLVPVTLAVVMMSAPVALAFGTFALARGPVLTVLALLFAIGAAAFGVFTMWASLTATESTAAIALFLFPLLEIGAFAIVLVLGLLADAIGRGDRNAQ